MKRAIILFVMLVVSATVISWFASSSTSGYKAVIKTQPLSHLEIYKGSKLVYCFAPVVPEEVGYPRPLELEKALIVGSFVVTSWGETGADYFGTHPILVSLNGGSCRAIQIYSGELSDDPRIKDYSWTRKDFFVTNYFDPTEKVKTILTQGVSVTPDKQLELTFYADEKPHAAEHSYAKIRVPILK